MKTIAIIVALTIAVLDILLGAPRALQAVAGSLDPCWAVVMSGAFLLSAALIVFGVTHILEVDHINRRAAKAGS